MAEECKPRVLLVEDDAVYADILTRKLTNEDIPHLHAPTGEDALDALVKDENPDLILLDISLPGIDGFEVLKRIKSDPATADIPVVIMSNFARPEDITWGEKIGAKRFVDKTSMVPAEVADLVYACARKRAVL